MEVEPLVRLVAAPLRRMDIDADVAHVTQDVAVLALRHGSAEMAAEAPVEEPQVVLVIAVDLDAAELIDAPAVFQELTRGCDPRADRRKRKVLFGQRVKRRPARLGGAQGILDLRNFIAANSTKNWIGSRTRASKPVFSNILGKDLKIASVSFAATPQ